MTEKSTLVALVFAEERKAGTYTSAHDAANVGTVQDVYPVKAEAALKEIDRTAKAAGVDLKDTVLAFRTPDNRVKVRQIKDLTTGKGAGRGTLMGFLVGLLFGGPLIGALGGLAIGAIIGKRTDRGLDDDFVSNVSHKLRPGSSVLLLLIDRELTKEGIDYLQSFGAEFHMTDMSREAEDAASQAAEDEAISAAMQEEIDVE